MIAHRGGHNFQTRGAKEYIDEVVECAEINKHINYYLNIANAKHIDVSPGNSSQSVDLKNGVEKANNNKATNFFSIHMNAYKKVDGPMGCEVWVYDDKNDNTLANNICLNLKKLGFNNRGVKKSKKYYELNNTKCKAMIIEICFVDSKTDVELYKKIGAKKIAKTIVETVLNKTINEDVKKGFYRVICDSFEDRKNALIRQEQLKEKGFNSFLEYKEV